MILWDLHQRAQIRTVRASQHIADREALRRDQRTEREVAELEGRLQELASLVEAMWTVCRDRLGLDDDDLSAAVDAVLAEREAALAAGPARCTECDAAITPDFERCQFCGAASPRAQPPQPPTTC